MVAMSTPSCPFCPFSDHSPYFLAQHIEAIHPEPDEPSFVSRHFLEDKTLMDVIRKEATTVEDAPSQDYIDCECGEAVLLGEFDDHVQLHSAESADMAVDTSQLPAGVTLSPPQQRLTRPPTAPPLRSVVLNAIPAVAKVAESPGYHHGTRPSKRKHDLHDKHGDKQDKQQHTVKEWIDLLLGSNASPSRANVHAPSAKDVKRLGVSHDEGFCKRCRLICETESGTGSLCPRGSNARMVVQATRTRCQSLHRQPDWPRWSLGAFGSSC